MKVAIFVLVISQDVFRLHPQVYPLSSIYSFMKMQLLYCIGFHIEKVGYPSHAQGLKFATISTSLVPSCPYIFLVHFPGLKCKQTERTGVDSGPRDREKSCQGSSAGVG